MSDSEGASAADTLDVETIRLDGADGVTLAADIVGDPGAPVVLLFHGGGQTRHSWGGAMRDLARRGLRVASVDMRGHGDSDWSPDGDYGAEVFPGDVMAVARQFESPVLVGASLGGTSSLMAVHWADEPIARALVLVDVAPNIEPEGVDHIRSFMFEHMHTGFADLEEVADAVAAYNPHRPRPSNLDGLKKNVRLRDDGRWYWHWDPAFMWGKHEGTDETRIIEFDRRAEALEDAARSLTIPTLLVRGRQSDLLSEEGAEKFLSYVPHAEFADIEGAGHMVAGDKNDVFNDAIVGFIDRLDVEGTA